MSNLYTDTITKKFFKEVMEFMNFYDSATTRLQTTSRDHYKYYSKEFVEEQTATEIITPTTGKRIFIKAMNCSTDSSTGEAWLHYEGLPEDEPLQKGHFSKYSSLCNPMLAIKLPVDEPLLLTTTTNTDKFFISLNYIEV